jgi:hypothetical protein
VYRAEAAVASPNGQRVAATYVTHQDVSISRERPEVHIGKSFLRGDLDTYRVVMDESDLGKSSLDVTIWRTLALQAPEQVAGIAIAGASLQAPEDSSCPEQGAVPLLVVQGEKDPIHPINGGKVTLLWFSYRGRVLSAFDTAQTFAKRLGVTSTPQQIHLDRQRSGDPTSADGFLWPGAPSPVGPGCAGI